MTSLRAREGRIAWVLNLDADLELAKGPRYAPTKAVRASMAAHISRLAASLLRPDDVLVDESSPPGIAEGLVGRAFCPTSRAVHLLRRAGAEPLPHPTQEVLREVNGRAFCAALGQTLPGAVFARDLETAKSMVGRMPTVAKQWRAKRAFTMAGRGQRCIVPGPLSEADTAFLRASITSDGGVQIEPSVTIVRELGIHALLEQSGELCLGRIVTQTCDEHGQWRSTSPAENVAAEVSDALTAEARRVARALHGAGYFGPFGIDAFEWEDESGVMRLQPRSEINARYSMGFAVGFGHELCSATGASP